MNNYRPVSNLCFIANILEKIVLSQVSSYLNSHNIYNTCESAYRPGHSTETALQIVVNDLFISPIKGSMSVLALLYFFSAFSTIDHSILVHRLHTHLGFTDDVLKFIKSSLDSNDMSVCIKEEIIPFVVNPFTYICNLSFYGDIFPNAMKIPNVLPVRNGAKNESNNRRPTSLLHQSSKILEKLLDLSMEEFTNKHIILHDCQFGIRSGRSPNMALLSLIENITTSCDAHKHAVCVSMDIKKTFDTIDHNT